MGVRLMVDDLRKAQDLGKGNIADLLETDITEEISLVWSPPVVTLSFS